jgi:hypothetical protein
MVRRHVSGEHKDAGAHHEAQAECGQLKHAEGALEGLVGRGVRFELTQRFSGEDSPGK